MYLMLVTFDSKLDIMTADCQNVLGMLTNKLRKSNNAILKEVFTIWREETYI